MRNVEKLGKAHAVNGLVVEVMRRALAPCSLPMPMIDVFLFKLDSKGRFSPYVLA